MVPFIRISDFGLLSEFGIRFSGSSPGVPNLSEPFRGKRLFAPGKRIVARVGVPHIPERDPK